MDLGRLAGGHPAGQGYPPWIHSGYWEFLDGFLRDRQYHLFHGRRWEQRVGALEIGRNHRGHGPGGGHHPGTRRKFDQRTDGGRHHVVLCPRNRALENRWHRRRHVSSMACGRWFRRGHRIVAHCGLVEGFREQPLLLGRRRARIWHQWRTLEVRWHRRRHRPGDGHLAGIGQFPA